MKLLPFTMMSAMLALFLICISCEKLLEVDTPENQIDTNQVFENVQTANAALAGLYAGVRDNSLVQGDMMGPVLGTYTDELDNYAVTTANGIIDLYHNQHIESNSVIYTAWAGCYQQIYKANALMEGVESSTTLSLADKNRIRGEALFLRTLLFYYLQQLFGDIPYPVTTDYQMNQSISKTPSSTVLGRLESDFRESANLLKDDYTNSERIFVNKKTAEMMLAKVLIAGNRWAEAEVLLKGIVQSPLYGWENDLSKVFLKSGKHIMWQLKPGIAGSATHEADIYYFVGAAPSNYAVSANLYNAFPVEDQRKQKWISKVYVGSETWYRAEKYKLTVNNTTEYSIVYRLEEVYLLLAETLTKQGKSQEAVHYVNATRKRAGLEELPPTLSSSVLLTEILDENRREFFAEMGKRFFDLKRAGQLNILSQIKPNWKDYHQLWPIPQKDLLLNSNLNPQNPGY